MTRSICSLTRSLLFGHARWRRPRGGSWKLDFASFHLELLQAFALTKPRADSVELLADKAPSLKAHMQEIGEALQLADLDFPSDLSEAEFRKRMVIHRITTAKPCPAILVSF